MLTILQSLKSVSGYPIPVDAITDMCEEAGINVETTASPEVRSSKGFKHAKAMVYLWLADAPNVSQGGISYSFNATERQRFRKRAGELLGKIGLDGDCNGGDNYGYMGTDL